MPSKDLAAFLLPSNPISVVAPPQQQHQYFASSSSIKKKKKAAVNPDTNIPSVHTIKKTTTSAGQKNDLLVEETTVVSLPKYSGLEVSLGKKLSSVIRDDSDNFPRGHASGIRRGDFGGFQCTSRGGSRVLALPEMATTKQQQQKSSDNNTLATPDVSTIESGTGGGGGGGGGVTLTDVWKFSMRAKAPLLCEIDPSTISRPVDNPATTTTAESSSSSSGGGEKIRIVRVRPEFLARGMVQPPQAEVVEVDRSTLENDSAAHLMTPSQRRDLMETQRRAREGLVALREVQAARTKLSRTCQKLYPHGALGTVDGPYSSHPDGQAYGDISKQLRSEDVKVARKGKKEAPAATARPHDTMEVVLNTTKKGEQVLTGANQIKTGISVKHVRKPADQLKAFAVGI